VNCSREDLFPRPGFPFQDDWQATRSRALREVHRASQNWTSEQAWRKLCKADWVRLRPRFHDNPYTFSETQNRPDRKRGFACARAIDEHAIGAVQVTYYENGTDPYDLCVMPRCRTTRKADTTVIATAEHQRDAL
jgi:hypothetical protein